MAYWAHGRQAGGEDDLQDIGPHRGHGGDAEDIDEHGEGDEAAADAHDGGQHADDYAAQGHDHPGDLFRPPRSSSKVIMGGMFRFWSLIASTGDPGRSAVGIVPASSGSGRTA